uniref:Zinc finger protein 292b n=1 Tax=Kryptolebias marmoratus TaxID=37003 RepID=A0A3Q3ALE6_KRYMA
MVKCVFSFQTLLEFAGGWRIEEEPLPVVQVYIVALLSYAEAIPFLSLQCENVSLVCCNHFFFKGLSQLSLLSTLGQYDGVWTSKVLVCILFLVEEFLVQEGPVLLQMRVKQLMKEKQMEKAAFLAKTCSESDLQGKEVFRQMYLVCLCAFSEQDQLMEKLSKEDCRDALEMICNLDSDGDDRAAFSLCSAFLTRQLLHGDTYCAWELTLFWSKLLKRLEPSDQAFLGRCRQMSLVSKSVYHILFLIKVIQSEINHIGLSLCIEMCIRALRIKSEDHKAKGSVCKTISCLLPSDLEVKQACQLTEFLLEPTVDAYYAVETLYNEPDQKLEEENMPIPNSLRCELLLVLKTQWPFDPEFWDWKTLKHHCLALMGEEASIVSSIDSLNEPEEEEDYMSSKEFHSIPDHIFSDLEDITNRKEKKDKDFTSAQFRNWQVYMQYCVLCDKEFLGHRIVRHAQIHLSSGIYTCPICAQTFTSKDTLIPHVTLHVKQSCKERLTAIKTNKLLVDPETSAQPVATLKISTHNEPHKNKPLLQNGAAPPRAQSKVVKRHVEINEDNMCPVGQCRRSFKFFKNLIAHVKGHGDDEEAKTFLELQSKKVVCQFCRRHFISVTHLNDHLQVHCGGKPYICIQLNCKASFLSNTELLIHKKKHTTFKARCMFPNCGKIFNAAFRLYDHEAHHYKTFTCKAADCGKVFHSQQQLDLHCEKHDGQKEKSPSPHQSLTNAKSDPPPTKQMVSNPSAQKQEDFQQNTAAGKTDHGGPLVSSENLLESQKESAEALTQPQNTASPISQMYNSNNSVIQSVRSHLNAPGKEGEDIGSLDCRTLSQRDPSVPLLKAKNLSQNQPQTFNVNDAVISYSSNSNLPLKILRRPVSCRNVLAVTLSRIPTDPATSQPVSRSPTDPTSRLSRVPMDLSMSESMSQIPLNPIVSQPTSQVPTEPTISQLIHQASKDPSVSEPMSQLPTNPTMSQTLSQTPTDPALQPVSRYPTHLSQPLTSTNPKISQPTSRFHTDQPVAQQVTQTSMNPTMPQPLSRTSTSPTTLQLFSRIPTDPAVSQPLSQIPTDPAVSQPLSQTSADPTMSQPLPPTLSSQRLPGSKLENSVMSSLAQRQRFHCAVETCARHYSTYKSVTKHMKAVHPEFYEKWTVAQTEIRISYVSAQIAPSVGLQDKQANMVPAHGVKRQNIIQSPPYSNRSSALQSPLPHNLNGSLLLANVLNPIVLSQLGTIRNPVQAQSEDSGCEMWHEQIQNCGSSSVFPSNQQMAPQVNSTGSIPSHSVPSCSTIRSATPGSSQSIIPSCVKSTYEVSQQVQSSPTCTSLMQSSLVSASRTTVKIKPEQLSHSSVEENQNNKHNQPPYGPANSGYGPENQKQTRKHTRTKCPAIIKDGKFVCRRCFRQFDSPKSLGGHLSKRTSCKPYQESELNTNLPQSFLGFVSSDQKGSISQPQSSDSDGAVYHKLNETITSGSPATNVYSTINYPQNNLTYENGESNDDILKQIMSESNMSDLFVQTPVPQPLFQNFCAPLAVTEHLQGTSVIQHTENVQMKPKGNAHTAGHCPLPCINRFTGSEFPDLVLSHPITDNSATVVTCGASTNNIAPGVIFQDEGYNLQTPTTTPDAGANLVMLPDGQLSQATIGCKQNLRKNQEKDIKKRLREQILAGDFQRRNICPSGKTDPKSSPRSTGTETSPSKDCGFQQFPHDADIDSVIKGNSVIAPGSSDKLKQLLNTQSFTCFRETLMVHQELPSPTVIPSSDPDSDPTESDPDPDSHQQCLTEIQLAFERLDLVRERSEQSLGPLKEDLTDTVCQTASSEVESQILIPPFFVKPFACEKCTFSSMSCESLWKHLSKMHNYTLEMVNDVKRRFGLYAPFKCQKCPKAFTRNSNLRHHYLSFHKLSDEEIADLDMQRRKAKTASTSIPNQLVNKNPPSVICSMHNPELIPSGLGQSSKLGFLSVQAGVSAEHWLQQQKNFSLVHNKQFSSIQDLAATPKNTVPMTPTKESLSRQVQPKTDITKKTRVKKSKSESSTYQYRPYCCVHQGCMAAFTIQHNLILHYRSVHQSALSALEVNKDKDQEQAEGAEEPVNCDEEQEEEKITEFRCQVKDCCCVFQEATHLFLHYLQLHEFSLDKVDRLLSSIRYGRFLCGHQGCTESFAAFRKYVDHVKKEHKDLNLAKLESFKCEVEGCNRSYTTKSNLLRHVMSKHSDMYQQKLKVQTVKDGETKHNAKTLHYQITKTSNGKENIESNKKIPLRANHTKRVNKSRSKHWLKYGKPSLKSKVDAIALCTKKFPLQYPCMIKSCISVMKSERDILKHYIGHGLSEKYLEQHRSHFIFCKKFPRLKCRSIRSDDSKSDNTSDLSDNETVSDPVLEGVDHEGSKPVLRRRTPVGMPVVLLDTKLSSDQHSHGSLTLKRKRGRPRKLIDKIVKRKKVLHSKKVDAVHHKEEESLQPSVVTERMEQSAPMASFKPMGFEMSFLKFLEQSNKSEINLLPSVTTTEKGKKQPNLKPQNTCVRFSNRQNLKSLSKVKICLGTAFFRVSDPMLKQLQDMRPTVVLKEISKYYSKHL